MKETVFWKLDVSNIRRTSEEYLLRKDSFANVYALEYTEIPKVYPQP
jgi:hypothetical protein